MEKEYKMNTLNKSLNWISGLSWTHILLIGLALTGGYILWMDPYLAYRVGTYGRLHPLGKISGTALRLSSIPRSFTLSVDAHLFTQRSWWAG